MKVRSPWFIAGGCIGGMLLAMSFLQFLGLLGGPAWAAIVIALALCVDIISIAMTPSAWRVQALKHQSLLLAALLFFAVALWSVQGTVAMEQPRSPFEQLSRSIATWMILLAGSLLLASLGVVEALERRRARLRARASAMS